MALIDGLRVEGFRSLNQVEVSGLSQLTALAGVNNSGKSNILRSLNLFFNSQSGISQEFDLDAEYSLFRPKRARKQVRVTVTFRLPTYFTFRDRLERLQGFIPETRVFTITKEWDRENPLIPRIYFNGAPADDKENIDLVSQFLSLISFRYVPSRTSPLQVIAAERNAIRSMIVRRIAIRQGRLRQRQKTLQGIDVAEGGSVFKDLDVAARETTKTVSQELAAILPSVREIRLALPASWEEMVLDAGFMLSAHGNEAPDKYQGDGVQNLLMLQILRLIDRDALSRGFGWRQATIWALEEPEASCHTSLEAEIAAYLRSEALVENNRLQVFTTTHSDLIIQQAETVGIVEQTASGTTVELRPDPVSALRDLSVSGVSRHVDPLLMHPRSTVVLLEGVNDARTLQSCDSGPEVEPVVVTLAALLGNPDRGGVSKIREYVKDRLETLKLRDRRHPVIFVFDWDAKKDAETLTKQLHGTPAAAVAFDESLANVELSRNWRGLERYLSSGTLRDAMEAADLDYGMTRKGRLAYQADYGAVKTATHKWLAQQGLSEDDRAILVPAWRDALIRGREAARRNAEALP